MDDLRLPAVAARLVAWHNRHPLARRITALQVHAIGYVAVPCIGEGAVPPTLDDVVEGAGGSLRERAQAQAQAQAQARTRQTEAVPAELQLDRRTLKPDFSENFIDPLTPRQVARFALRAGRVLSRPPADGPVRQVRADGADPGRAQVPVYLLTAVIETGTRKSRVLLGAGDGAEVLGYRIFSTPRLAAVLAPLAVLAAVLLAPMQAPMQAAAPPVVVLAQQAPAAPAPQAADPASAPASSAAAEDASAEPAAPTTPMDVEPRLGRIELPDLRAQVTRVNKEQAFRSPDAPPRAPADAASSVEPGPPAASAPPRAEPTPPGGPAYAVSTRPLRTRAEADQVRVAMVSLLKAVAADEVHVDVLPEGDDWRVVGLPFASRAAADKARGLLVSRGMRVEVLAF
jgi:hypothetical protein